MRPLSAEERATIKARKPKAPPPPTIGYQELALQASGASVVTPPRSGPRRLLVTPASEIQMEAVEWVWDDHRLPLGALSLLAGDPGVGKSTLAYMLAAQLTTGTLPGCFQGIPKDVLVVAAEDSWEHTITPRLVAAG